MAEYEERIGVDESGKGDFFGPLVTAACYVGPEHYAVLEEVQDSKKLTDKKAIRLAAEIKQFCPHEVIVIGPERYNELYKEIKNLNRLLEWCHAQAISGLAARQPSKVAISDQFAKNTSGLRAKLDKRGCEDMKLISRVRAEADLAVAAASVLARAEFLHQLKRLGDIQGMELPKGAGPQVITAGRNLVRINGEDALRQTAKLHFKTTQKVLL
jgi:ribonuclease HIII